jgi:hypothetical protein
LFCFLFFIFYYLFSFWDQIRSLATETREMPPRPYIASPFSDQTRARAALLGMPDGTVRLEPGSNLTREVRVFGYVLREGGQNIVREPIDVSANTVVKANSAYSFVYSTTPAVSATDTDTQPCRAFYPHPLAPLVILHFVVGAVVAMFFSGTANGWCVGHVVAIRPEPDCYPYYVYSISIALSDRMKYEIYVDGNGELSYSLSPGVLTRIASQEVVVLSHMARSVP